MSAPTALESITTGDPGASGEAIANISSQESATIEIVAGVAMSDRIANGPSAQRAGLTGDDTATTDMSTVGFAGSAGANLEAINNRGALIVWCEFANSAGSATVRPIFYDGNNAPLFVGPALTFTAMPQRVSASGDYMSEPQVIDTYGASKYRCYLSVKGTGNLDIFAHPI